MALTVSHNVPQSLVAT